MARRLTKKTTDQYTHPSAKRVNLPTEQTGKTMSDTDRQPILHQPHSIEIDDEPILAWNRQPANQTGHAAHPLYVREKVHPAAFIKLLQGGGEQSQLFKDFNGLPSPDAAYEWYQHAANWSNRLIHGESTRVMASLLARENMTGKVQMIFFDPPYGMGYKSNFQVSIKNREVPENAKGRPHDTRTIRAFRDTYERGIHSYLDLTREKLVLMRELLADTGSLFMQIGDENVLRVGLLLDEVFGSENRVCLIPFATTSGSSSKTLPSVADFLLWYAKDIQQVKYHQLYEPLTRAEKVKYMSSYVSVELQNGSTRSLTSAERSDPDGNLPNGARLYTRRSLDSQGHQEDRSGPYFWEGRHWPCTPGRHWSVSMEGMDRLAELRRLDAAGPDSAIRWKSYEDEVPGRRINNIWHQQAYASDKRYVVQTAVQVIERCVLMATDPGDLVFDPTCGGATTAVAAETWGRRWITCDTSPVAVSIARQRLATATFPFWALADSYEGACQEATLSGKPPALPPVEGWANDPAQGFVYERVPRVSASVLAYDLDPDPIMLVDQPRKKRAVIRVASPMTVESEQPWATVIPLEGTDDEMVVAHGDFSQAVETALMGHTIRGGRNNTDMTIRALEPWPSDSKLLAWKATYATKDGSAEHTAAVMVAAEDVTVPGEMIREAARDIADSAERAEVLLVVAYAYAADAPATVGRVTVARAQMNRDLMIRELSAETGHEAFVIIGEPDIRIIDGYAGGQIAVEVRGYDTFDPATGNAAEGGPTDVACWMLDTDHDGESFYAHRVHFPGATKDRQIKRLIKQLGKNADNEQLQALTAMTSAPFDPPQNGRIAVKVITATGMEMTSVRPI